MDIAGIALEFIAAYGLIAIFILLVMDGSLMLPVFPGEIVLIMAVAAYAHDMPSLIFLIAFTSAAGVLGSLLLYGVTRGGGRRLVERFPRFFMMPRKRRERLERSFEKPLGQSLVLFLRLFPLTRVLVNIPAGLARMPLVRFVVLSTIGLVAYHAAFLWFTYEARRPGSAISDQAEQLQAAYASPAMAFVEANLIISGAVVIVLGAIFSLRASANMRRDPEESAGSIIGWLATMVLLWGGVALAAATYMEPDMVYFLIELGGLDIHAIAAALGYAPVPVLFVVAGVCMLLGFILHRVNRAAKLRRQMYKAEQIALAKLKVEMEARAAMASQPVAESVEFTVRPQPADQGGWTPDERYADTAPAPEPEDGSANDEEPSHHDGALDDGTDQGWDGADAGHDPLDTEHRPASDPAHGPESDHARRSKR